MRMCRAICAAGLALSALLAVFVVQEGQLFSEEHTLLQAQANQAGGIHGVMPAKGPFHGNNEVTIAGHNLCSGGVEDIALVSIKGVPVDKIVSAAADRIVVKTASMSGSERMPGRGDVVVVSHSKGRTKGTHMYEYKPAPIVYAIEPDNGAHKGGTTITINGQNLCEQEDQLNVEVCGVAAKNPQCMGNRVVATTSEFDTDRSSGEACDMFFQSKVFGHVVSHRAFSYRPAPVITHITPREGRAEGGNEIHIYGSDLTAGKGRISERLQVLMNGKPATVVDYTPSTVIAKVPHGLNAEGFVEVEVVSQRHGSAKSVDMYSMRPKPTITHLSAKAGRANGGEHLTIFGKGFGRGDIEQVLIGEHSAQVLWADPRGRKIKVTTPGFERHDEGEKLPVTIKSRMRGHAKLPEAFHVYPRGMIHKIEPTAGPAAGGTQLTITGRHLGNELDDFALVKVNDAPATILEASPERVVVKTHAGAPGVSGEVKVYSRRHGITTTPTAMKYSYSTTPQVASIRPSMSNTNGGELVILQGQNLCNTQCDDLEHVQIGNALVTEFTSRSSKRIVFHSPPGAQAGGAGPKTVTVRSKTFGDAEVPEGFTYIDGGSAGVVWPADVPMQGSTTVLIEGPNLGDAEEYRVLLAGVEAKVLSASSKKIEVQAGDAAAYVAANQLDPSEGLRGSIIVETMLGGKTTGMDTGITFKYNPACRIDRVESTPGPADGDRTITLIGANLGMGDERLYIDNKPAEAGYVLRTRQGTNVHRLSVRSEAPEGEPQQVVLKSARTGVCSWTPQGAQPAQGNRFVSAETYMTQQ